MSKYKLSLFDYHAVEKAEIELSGITVLTGINGCGKSTISQWLICLVDVINNFDAYICKKYGSAIDGRIEQLIKVRDELSRIRSKPYVCFLRDHVDNAIFPFEKVERLVQLYEQVLNSLVEELQDYLLMDKDDPYRSKILCSLDIQELTDCSDIEIETTIKAFRDNELSKVLVLHKEMSATLDSRPLEAFEILVGEVFGEEFPEQIQLFEDGVALLNRDDGVMAKLRHLQRATYIDTAMGVVGDDNTFWKWLNKCVTRTYFPSMPIFPRKHRLLSQKIQKSLKGRVESRDHGILVANRKIHYLSDDGLDIDIKNVAAGDKTFAYLQRLIDNGFLGKETLLLIDEPEAHLHPQRVVEMAHLLVLIHKNLKVKILLSSHSPDMIAALQALSRKERVSKDVHFYIAQEHGQNGKFIYKDLGCEIEEILASFKGASSMNCFKGFWN